MKKLNKITLLVTLACLMYCSIGLSQNPMWSLSPNNYEVGFSDFPLPIPTFQQFQQRFPGTTQAAYDNQVNYPYMCYRGASALSASNSMVDANGELLFFIVDQFIYDKEGFCIGLLNFDSGLWTTDPYNMFFSEILVLPNPTNCNQYYIFGSPTHWGQYFNPVFGGMPYYAILDLSLPVPNSENWLLNDGCLVYNPNFSGSTVFSIEQELIPSNVPFSQNTWVGNAMYAALPNQDNDGYLIFLSTHQGVYTFNLNSQGLNFTGNYFMHNLTMGMGSGPGDATRSELEVHRMADGNIRIAFGWKGGLYTNKLTPLGMPIPGEEVIISHEMANNPFNGSTIPYVKGVEFFGDNLLYYTHLHDSAPYYSSVIKYIDFTNLAAGPIALNPSLSFSAFQYSFIESDGQRLYFVGENANGVGNRLAALSSPANPLPSNFVDFFAVINYSASTVNLNQANIMLNGYSPEMNKAYTLPDQIDNYNYASIYLDRLACCIETRPGNKVIETTGNESWSQGSIPSSIQLVGNEIYILEELRVKAGTILTLEGLVLKFSPTAKIVVERGDNNLHGGKLVLRNTTLTIDTRCSNTLMWPGIEVQGHPNLSQGFPTSSSSQHVSQQGAVYVLQGSVIEHAYKGISTIYTFPSGMTTTTYGGAIVVAEQSTFRNNEIDVQLSNYSANNKSYFKLTSFITDAPLLDPNRTPKYHLGLFGVRGVGISGCTFENSAAHEFAANQQGIGIASLNAGFTVNGDCGLVIGCPNPNPSVFKNLHRAISSSGFFGGTRPFSVEHSRFENNHAGIYAQNVNNLRIQRCEFFVYNSAAPNYTFPTTGIHLSSCTNYIVQDNNLSNAYTNDIYDIGNTIGILINNSGETANRVYRNRLKGLNVGLQAQHINGSSLPLGPGLEFKCNAIGGSSTADIGVTSGRIAVQQGTCVPLPSGFAVSSPAGNAFESNPFGTQFNIWANPGVAPFSYSHHTGTLYTPMIYTAGIVNPTLCDQNGAVHYDPVKSCPSRIRSAFTLVAIESITSEWNALIEDLNSKNDLLQAASSEQLQTLVTSPSISHGAKKDALLPHSPYLSDEVLLAYLGQQPPAGHLAQVISANSPVSEPVWDYIQQLTIPNGIRKQLTSLQGGASPRLILQQEIALLSSERELLRNEFITTYLLDTTLSHALDSVHQLIEREFEGVNLIKERINFYLLTDQIQLAQNELENYAVLVGFDTYYRMVSMAIDAALSAERCLLKLVATDSTTQENVREIAANTNERSACVSAQALLELALNEPYEREIEYLYMQMGMMQTAQEEPTALTASSQPDPVLIFPNPAANEFSVVIDWESSQLEEVQVSLFSLSGQLVYRAEGQSGHQLHTFDATDIQPGIYLIRVQVNGEDVTTQKLLIQK
jgi:hypothetical protein